MFVSVALPQPVLSALPAYLSAYDLNRFHDIFTAKGMTYFIIATCTVK